MIGDTISLEMCVTREIRILFRVESKGDDD